MKKLLPFLSLLLITSLTLQGQIIFKLEMLEDESGWGVYAKYDSTSAQYTIRQNPSGPSDNIDVGSAQVTILASTGFSFKDLKNVNGIWSQNSRVNAPVENPTVDYIDVGYLSSFPTDAFTKDEPALLFTFSTDGDCPEILKLMALEDPFYAPNSAGNNPTNNFDAIDKGYLPNIFLYQWSDNYEDCQDVCTACAETVSSLDEKLIASNLRISPNPSFGNFNITLGEIANEISQISIVNNLGQIVFETKTIDANNEINMDAPSGIYNILFQQNDKSIISKRIVITN